MIAITARLTSTVRLRKLHASCAFPSPSFLPMTALLPIWKTKVSAMTTFSTG